MRLHLCERGGDATVHASFHQLPHTRLPRRCSIAEISGSISSSSLSDWLHADRPPRTSPHVMLSTLGRVPKLAVLVALALTFAIAIHISSFPALSRWKLPVLSGQQPHITNDESEGASQESPQKASQEPSPDLAHGSPLPTATPLPPHNAIGLNESAIPCQLLKGAEDVLVVMRTGATEIKDKLPAHLNTTVRFDSRHC